MNRITRLSKKTFSRYTDIKLLYLFDNTIHYIEPGTFEKLTDLEAIDLSINSLATISIDLLNLPRLRNLYYNDNLLEWDRIDADLQVEYTLTLIFKNKRSKQLLFGSFSTNYFTFISIETKKTDCSTTAKTQLSRLFNEIDTIFWYITAASSLECFVQHL